MLFQTYPQTRLRYEVAEWDRLGQCVLAALLDQGYFFHQSLEGGVIHDEVMAR